MSHSSPTDAPQACRLCSQLADEESSFYKYGWDEQNTFLPAAAHSLQIVRSFEPYGSSRLLQLRQCPECGTYYLYRTDYVYLVNGTEDEEFLTRLTDEQAAEYLARPLPKRGKAP